MQQGNFVTSGVESTVTSRAGSKDNAPNRAHTQPDPTNTCHSLAPLRTAVGFMVATLILAPGGFRALMYAGVGWEAWWFSPAILVALIAFHLIFCWAPLALRYFKPG